MTGLHSEQDIDEILEQGIDFGLEPDYIFDLL